MGCNDQVGDKNSRRYKKRPPGNSPEFMPLDNSLFQDYHMAVKTNVAASFHLPTGHEDKFDISTPNRIVHCYERIWDSKEGGVPLSSRVIQDVDKMIYSYKQIVNAKGAVVKGVATREGHRNYVDSYEDVVAQGK